MSDGKLIARRRVCVQYEWNTRALLYITLSFSGGHAATDFGRIWSITTKRYYIYVYLSVATLLLVSHVSCFTKICRHHSLAK